MKAYQQHLRNLAALDREIRAGRLPNASTMARTLGVHARTVHRYVAFLRLELRAPLRWDARRNGFTYRRQWNFGKALLAWLAQDT